MKERARGSVPPYGASGSNRLERGIMSVDQRSDTGPLRGVFASQEARSRRKAISPPLHCASRSCMMVTAL